MLTLLFSLLLAVGGVSPAWADYSITGPNILTSSDWEKTASRWTEYSSGIYDYANSPTTTTDIVSPKITATKNKQTVTFSGYNNGGSASEFKVYYSTDDKATWTLLADHSTAMNNTSGSSVDFTASFIASGDYYIKAECLKVFIINLNITEEQVEEKQVLTRDESKFYEDFSGNALPADWETVGIGSYVSSYNWKFTNGYAEFTQSYSSESTALSWYAHSLVTPKLNFTDNENFVFSLKRDASYDSYASKVIVEYSADKSAWTAATDGEFALTSTDFEQYYVKIPETAHHVRFKTVGAAIDDVWGGELPVEPKFTFTPADKDFGLITEDATSDVYTITNDGLASLTNVTVSVESGKESYFEIVENTISSNTIAAGASATFKVKAKAIEGAYSAVITVSADGFDSKTFTVKSAKAKAGTLTIDFDDNQKPNRWEDYKPNSYSAVWQYADGAAYTSYNQPTLISPKLKFAEGDFLVLKAKINSNSSSYYVTVKGSSDNGTTWTAYTKKLSNDVLNATDYTTVVLSDIPTTVNKIQLTGYYGYVDEIAGLIYSADLVVKQGDDTVTSPATYGFGESGAEKTVTYSLTNAAEGTTLNITDVKVENGADSHYTTNWTESVAAPFDLVITQPYDADDAGEKSATVTVTTSDGTFVINVSGTTLAADAPKLAVLVGDAAQESGAALDFGIITADATKELVIKNDGTGTLNVTEIALPEGYSIDATLPLALTAGQTKTVTLTLAASSKAIRTADEITIKATGFEDFTLNASATVMPGAVVVDFNDNKLPDNWTYVGDWTYDTGAAYSKSNSETDLIISPKLKFADNDFIVLKAKGGDNSSSNFVSVRTSTDNGATWTTLKKITQSSTTFTDTDFSTIVIDGISSAVNKIAIASYWAYVDDIAGLTIDDNDPRLGIYTDAECTAAATTAETKDFGFVTEDQTATYYIKNDGTGTMTLALGDQPAGFTQNLDKTSVAAGEKATLTITMAAADNAGFHAGNVVVTATDLGTFTVTATGVVVDDSKLNLDFATANIPATWTANNWSKNASGYLETSGYSSTSLETSTLTAEAGEEIVIVAKQTYSSSSYTFGVKYKKADAEEWSDLIAAANIGTNWTTLHAPIAEAGDYVLQFNGSYAQILHIYGLTEPNEPVMVVYDGEAVAAATYSFGSVDNSADATHTFTVKNEGKAVLAGLKAELSGEQASHYTVNVTGLTDGGVAAGTEATITVTQLKDNLGAHAATLTISSTSEGIDSKEIALSGTTRDASKLYVDFQDAMPDGWTAVSWSRTSTGTNYYAQASNSEGTLTTPALTVAAGEKITFDAKAQYSAPTFKVRYTTDGAVTWTEKDLSSSITNSGWTTLTLDLENSEAATAFIQFVGKYAQIDNFYGGTVTTAPMIALTEGSTAVENGSTKEFGSLTAAGVATYTLKNDGTADLVSTVATTGSATAAISGEGEGITIVDSKVTLAAGKSATITLTVPFEEPYGERDGALTITSEGGVGTLTVNYTATTIDPTALFVNFDEEKTWPAGWYHDSDWTVYNSSTDYYARNYSSSKASDFITQKLTVDGTDDALTFKAAAYNTYYTPNLTVSYSKDRKEWTPIAEQPTGLTTSYQTFTVKGLEADDYYLKFSGNYLYIDEIVGWHKATGIEHDLYISASNIPAADIVPETSITATATVNSLIAAESGVYAKLIFTKDATETIVATAEAADIAKNGSKAFTLTGNVPAEEGTYAAKIVVYNADNSVAFETLTTDIELKHIRTLAISEFTRTSNETLTANENNEITVEFTAKVQNTGTTELKADEVSVTLLQGETEIVTVKADAALAKDADVTLTLNKTISAGEGGEQVFSVRENVGNTTFATTQTITVQAAAPKFELAVKEGAAVYDGDAVAFGLVKEATTKNYTISNTGNKALELVSIVAPEGFEATALTAENKTVAAEGSLDIDVTLLAEQGKAAGDLVITYKVDASTQKTFTLALTGRSVSADTWTETFDTEIPSNWTNGGWTWDEDEQMAYSTYTEGYELMTPRLAAANGEELTYDVVFRYSGYALKAQYSTDKTTWNDIATYSATSDNQAIEGSFVAPAAGNYYIKFSAGRYVRLDNFVGFQLNVPEHDTEIAAENVPTTGTQYADYTATVTLKENAGKAEDIIADLYVDGTKVATTTKTITANGQTVVTVTWTPEEAIETAVKAYIQVTGTEIDLKTAEVELTISEAYTLDEEGDGSVKNATYAALVLKRTFAAGWNTVCLPFAISNVESVFGEGAKAYNFTDYTDGVLNFTSTNTLNASYPYIVYVPAAITEPIKLKNIEISYAHTTPSATATYFKGTYAPITAGNMTGMWGVTSEAKIAKGTEKASILGFRAYFEGITLSATGSAPSLSFFDVTTGITKVIAADQLHDGKVYNLNGQQVENAKKGLYIVNGRKVVVK